MKGFIQCLIIYLKNKEYELQLVSNFTQGNWNEKYMERCHGFKDVEFTQ